MVITAAEPRRWHAHGLDLGRWVKGTAMEQFVRRENIKRYRKLLREAKDQAERRLIQKLLIVEEQKELAARTASPSTARWPHVSSWRTSASTVGVGSRADQVRRSQKRR
jgi:hypothetical protein